MLKSLCIHYHQQVTGHFVSGGGISVKLATSIHHVSWTAEKVFKVRGQGHDQNSVLIMVEAYILTLQSLDLLVQFPVYFCELCSHVFEEIQTNSIEIWKFGMYFLVTEYDKKPGLAPPFIIIEHAFLVLRWIWQRLWRCCHSEEGMTLYFVCAVIINK